MVPEISPEKETAVSEHQKKFQKLQKLQTVPNVWPFEVSARRQFLILSPFFKTDSIFQDRLSTVLRRSNKDTFLRWSVGVPGISSEKNIAVLEQRKFQNL